MTELPFDHARLDQARLRGDPEADALLARAVPEPWQLALSPPIWLDGTRVVRAQHFAEKHLLHITLALFYAALPTSYAAARGAKLLATTGRMSHDLDLRINETARFLLEVLEPCSLENGVATRALRQVRLGHARVRRGLQKSAPTSEAPINQEDLLGTLFAFSVVVVRALRRLGVSVTDVEADDYFHLWRGYGALLGIEESLLPPDFATAELGTELIAERQFAPSEAGRSLMKILDERIARHVPLPGSTSYLIRRLAGDRVADILGVASDQAFRTGMVKLTSVPWLGQLQLGQFLLSATPLVARPLLASVVRHKLAKSGQSSSAAG
jgi:hypothetical protein